MPNFKWCNLLYKEKKWTTRDSLSMMYYIVCIVSYRCTNKYWMTRDSLFMMYYIVCIVSYRCTNKYWTTRDSLYMMFYIVCIVSYRCTNKYWTTRNSLSMMYYIVCIVSYRCTNKYWTTRDSLYMMFYIVCIVSYRCTNKYWTTRDSLFMTVLYPLWRITEKPLTSVTLRKVFRSCWVASMGLVVMLFLYTVKYIFSKMSCLCLVKEHSMKGHLSSRDTLYSGVPWGQVLLYSETCVNDSETCLYHTVKPVFRIQWNLSLEYSETCL